MGYGQQRIPGPPDRSGAMAPGVELEASLAEENSGIVLTQQHEPSVEGICGQCRIREHVAEYEGIAETA